MNWEYKVLQIDNALKGGFGKLMGDSLSYITEQITSVVNTDGNQGWELVEVIPTVGSTGTASKLLLFFKRPKS
jgi:Domain of unknown function (DUF4177)